MPGTIKKVVTSFGDTYILKDNIYTYIGEVLLVHSNSGYIPDGFKVEVYKNVGEDRAPIIIGTREFVSTFKTDLNGVSYTGIDAVLYSTQWNGENFGFIFNGISYPADTPITQPTTTPKSSSTESSTESTAKFNSPPTQDLKDKKKELKDNVAKLQKIGLPPVSEIGQQLWDNLIKPKLLTERQIEKKIILMQGQSSQIPIDEERAQLIVYGKTYYKDGILFDNDAEDPSCVSQPSDDDYEPPIDENHPLWKKIVGMLDEIKDSLLQLGIKLGEFIVAQPQAIAVMATSIIALVSSVVILPFGSGLPAALTAVQTMMSTIQSLQAKTSEILPLLVIMDYIGLILPKNAQSVISQINVIISIYMGVLAALTVILGILDSIISKLKKAKSDMENIPIKIELKSEPNPIKNKISGAVLSVEATNGAWEYTYEWTDQNGSIISKDSTLTKDNGKRTITPKSTQQYTCKVTDSKGATQEKTFTVTVI
jgi:hypothetical protein